MDNSLKRAPQDWERDSRGRSTKPAKEAYNHHHSPRREDLQGLPVEVDQRVDEDGRLTLTLKKNRGIAGVVEAREAIAQAVNSAKGRALKGRASGQVV